MARGQSLEKLPTGVRIVEFTEHARSAASTHQLQPRHYALAVKVVEAGQLPDRLAE